MHEIKWASCCLMHAIMQLVNYNFKPAVVHEKKKTCTEIVKVLNDAF